MSEYYYRGIRISEETEDYYNAWVVEKINDLTQRCWQEKSIENLRKNNISFCFTAWVKTSKNELLIIEISEAGVPLFGVYNTDKQECIDVQSSYFVSLSDNKMNNLTYMANNLAQTATAGIIDYHYNALPPAVKIGWGKT